MIPDHVTPEVLPQCPACRARMATWELDSDNTLTACRSCGFVRRDLHLSPARARLVEYGGDPAADRVRTALTAHRIRSRVNPSHMGSVLEIGAGGGHLAARLAEEAGRVVAVDVHPPAAGHARHPRMETVVGRFEDVDLPEGSFSLVLGIHVLEHVTDVGATLALVRRLLAPGGIGYFITPNAECSALSRFGADWWMLEDPTHVQFLSPRSAELLARTAGFSEVTVRRLVTDSLACDAATLARRFRREAPARGVLDHRSTRLMAAALLPLSLALRGTSPSWRPAMEVVVR